MIIRGPFAFIIVILLIVSLAANFLILGFAASRFRGGDEVAAIERIVTLGARAYPREMRDEIGDRLGRNRRELRAAFRDVRNARRQTFTVMAAEPFDRSALESAFAEVREKTEKLQRLGQELVSDVVEEASPATRAKIRPPRHLRR